MNFFKYNRIPLLNFPIPVLLGEGKNEAKKDIDISDEENSASYPTPKEGKDITHDLEIVIESISMMGDFRVTQRKECQSLVRRVKILLVLLDEIKELNISISDTALTRLSNLKKALLSAKKLLTTCTESSKIYLALEYEAIMGLFTSTNGKLCRALDAMPYDELGISDEVKEQIELMGHQLKRSKRRTDSQDMELAMDMMVVFGKQDIDRNADIAMKQRLAKKLDLHTMADLEAEALAVRRLAKEKLAGAAAENIQNIVDILNKFKQIAGIEECNVLLDEPKKTEEFAKCNAMEIPLEFLCPITLEIMTDPVIVATGQTYERASIQQWLDSNRRTCPKTGQVLTHLSLAPNYALKNLILQWCEKNNFRPSKKTDTDGAESQSSGESSSNEHKEQIMSLVKDLSSKLDKQRDAAQKLRLLAKENPENRVLIAEFGGIAPLVKLLSYSDSKLREHAVTALLNLSIDDSNKKLISAQGAIPAIIDVLETGSAGAKENAAAALFSLSMLEENKVVVGVSIGIPPLVELLRTGTVRGMRDAVTALFNLCLNHSNKARAIDAGIVRPLLKLLEDKEKGMVDEALSILLLLVSHPQGRQEIAQLTFIETLVNFMKDGTPKNKEGAAAILFELGLNGGSSFLLAALQYGVYEHLVEMTQTGTSRAQRKSGSIMQLMSKYEQIP